MTYSEDDERIAMDFSGIPEEHLQEILDASAQQNEDAWFETFSRIMLKSGAVVNPTLNVLQRDICDAIRYCREHQIPCRLVILKPRQVGVSTGTTACLYHHLNRVTSNGVIIGGEYSQTDNLWNITRRYSQLDQLAWPEGKSKIDSDKGVFPNGSRLVKETAQDEEAGRSGTFQFVISTEIGRWKDTATRKAGSILSGLLNCVPNLPDTVVILESTAQGPSGVFYDRWLEATDWSDVRATNGGWRGRWIRLFAPWFAFEDYRNHKITAAEEREILDFLTEDEKDLLKITFTDGRGKVHIVTPGHLAWRRVILKEECNGDVSHFDREYPSTPDHAFRASSPSRFDRVGLDWQKRLACMQTPKYGMLEVGEGGKTIYWRPCDKEESVIVRWETPVEGMYYLLAADTMTGASQVGGSDPDCHAVLVLRRGYFDPERGWRRPAVVARITSPCRWDIDVLSEYTWRLATYYGKCMVVPEVNQDRGLVELLRLKGDLPIYQREIFNHVNQKKSKALGWQTTGSTRLRIEEAIAKAIREHDEQGAGVELNDHGLIRECETFCRNHVSGRAEALPGAHDDDVIALGIGLCCIEGATRFKMLRATPALPRDLARHEKKILQEMRNRKKSKPFC
jgi:hypothetical protein